MRGLLGIVAVLREGDSTPEDEALIALVQGEPDSIDLDCFQRGAP